MSRAPTIEAIIRGPRLFRRGLLTMSEMLVGDPCMLTREPTNPADANAVIVSNSKERPFGYIQREKAVDLARWMDKGWVYTCAVIKAPKIKRVNGFIGVETDGLIVRCIPLQPISLSKPRSIFSDLLESGNITKELEKT